MIITKMSLPRRTFLRGIGAMLSLPLLDAMVPALTATAKTAAKPVQRMGFIYIPNGAAMDNWTPRGEGPLDELSPILAPLEPFKNNLVVVTGLAHMQANLSAAGQHTRAQAVWLSGVQAKRTEASDVRGGKTLDQIAADHLCEDTALRSLETTVDPNFVVGHCDSGYSCVYLSTISWRTPTTALPMEHNPRVVFERMFGNGGTAAERLADAQTARSILDSVKDDMSRLQRKIGAGDRLRVTEYLDAVRDVETRIQKSEANAEGSTIPTLERPVGVPESYDEHAKLMFDLQVLACQVDITRVFTFMLGREVSQRPYPIIGVPGPHHSISHHQNDPEKLAQLTKINTYHASLFAYMLNKLQSTQDGASSLLDQSMWLYGGGISDSDKHDHVNLPLIMVGGGGGRVKGGIHMRYDPEKLTPATNFFRGMLDKIDVPLDSLADSSGVIELPSRS